MTGRAGLPRATEGMNGLNAYETLGLPPDADEKQVRQAYHALVKACHPDQFSDPAEQKKAQEDLIRLNLAYEEALRQAGEHPPLVRTLPLIQAKETARRLLSQERYESALLQLGKAEARDDEWYYIQGQLLMGMRQYGSAHQAFREAIRLRPDNNAYRQGALDAAVAIKKHQKLAYRVADWAGGFFHSRRR